MKARTARLAAALALAAPSAALGAPAPGPAYGDHMVLQQGQPIVIAGTAGPGSTVTGTFGAARAQARAGADGAFRLIFPPREASPRPETLVIQDTSGRTALSDVLVGDVYLCSGQSNMELPVTRSLNASSELANAADDGIRLLKVPKTTAATPKTAFPQAIGWTAADGETVADFSAACFFMAKQLRTERPGIPVGLIHSNWGGSAARAWLDPAGVKAFYGQQALDQLALYETDPLAAAQAFAPQWYEWWRTNDGGREPWTDPSMLDWKPVPQISFWNRWTGSGLDTTPVANVWLRQDFELTAEQAKNGGTLSVGALDDLDLTWVNGHPVGYTFGWGVERQYRVPARYLKEGRNSVLIAVNNAWDNGGFFAGADRLYFEPGNGDPIPLGSDWDYAIGTVRGVPPRAPWDANAGTGVMHNAMIAPIGPMRLAGVAWYQGESDVGQPDYDARLKALFAGWRAQFGQQARMLVVQLADFGPLMTQPAASGWAQLRQEQLDAVVADGNAALVSAIDIGEPSDIHPANKPTLGKRLAAAALGKPMPMPRGARIASGSVIVTFDGIDGGLVAYGGPYPLGVELCGATQESCRWALAAIDGDRLVVPLDGKPAARVRHAWADAPVVNLHDRRGMPVPGFELAIDQ